MRRHVEATKWSHRESQLNKMLKMPRATETAKEGERGREYERGRKGDSNTLGCCACPSLWFQLKRRQDKRSHNSSNNNNKYNVRDSSQSSPLGLSFSTPPPLLGTFAVCACPCRHKYNYKRLPTIRGPDATPRLCPPLDPAPSATHLAAKLSHQVKTRMDTHTLETGNRRLTKGLTSPPMTYPSLLLPLSLFPATSLSASLFTLSYCTLAFASLALKSQQQQSMHCPAISAPPLPSITSSSYSSPAVRAAAFNQLRRLL